MNTRNLLFLLVALCLVSSAYAQEDYAQQTSKFTDKDPNIFEQHDIWGVGLHAGLLSGMGVGVRYHPKGRFGFQLVGGLISSGDETPYSVGFEGQFDFDARGLSRFYGYLAGGYYSNGKDDNPETEEHEDLEGPLRLGLGFAYEWPISSKIIFNLNLGFMWFSDGEIYPLPQAGLFYYFN